MGWRRWRERRYRESWQTVGPRNLSWFSADWFWPFASQPRRRSIGVLGCLLVLALTGLSIAFRMAPLLAITTELVNASERGTFLALRNAVSQLGIAASTLSASYLFASSGYAWVGVFSACLLTISSLVILIFVKEPQRKEI